MIELTQLGTVIAVSFRIKNNSYQRVTKAAVGASQVRETMRFKCTAYVGTRETTVFASIQFNVTL